MVSGGSECRAYSDCSCSDGQFCNFDYDSYGGCESCDNHADESSCYSDGLPSAGEEDCVNCCFGDTSSEVTVASVCLIWKEYNGAAAGAALVRLDRVGDVRVLRMLHR